MVRISLARHEILMRLEEQCVARAQHDVTDLASHSLSSTGNGHDRRVVDRTELAIADAAADQRAAIRHYRTEEQRRLFYGRPQAETKALDFGPSGAVRRSFAVGDVVARFIPRRSRAKHQDVWTEPQRVLKGGGGPKLYFVEWVPQGHGAC